MEEEEWDESPTVEDVICSVLKSKSKFGKIKLSLPPRPPRRNSQLSKDSTCGDDLPKTKTEDLNSLLYGKERIGMDGGGTAKLSVDESNQKSLSGRVSPQHREKLDPNNFGPHRISMSSSKLLRSSSTPEVRAKSCVKASVTMLVTDSARSGASRQMNFSEMPRSGNFDKENTNPILDYDTLEEKYSNTIESILKPQQPKPVEKSNLMQDLRSQSHFEDDFNLRGVKAANNHSQEASKTGDTLKRLLEGNGISESLHAPVIQKEPKKDDPFKKANDAKFVSTSNRANLTNKSYFSIKSGQTPNQKPSVSLSTLPTGSSYPRLSPDSSTGNLSHQTLASSQKLSVPSSAASNGRSSTATASNELVQKSEIKSMKEGVTGLHKNVTTENVQVQTHSGVSKERANSDKSPTVIPKHSMVSQAHSHATHTTTSGSQKPISAPKVSQNNLPLHQGTTTKNKSPTSSVEMKTNELPSIPRPQLNQVQTPCSQRLKALPPTPPTKHKLQQMDHINVNGQEYLKLGIVGRGGSSKVYEVLDLDTRKVKAIKVVDLEGVDKATLDSYKNEIDILHRLQWSDKVIHLYDYEHADSHLKLIMEKGNRDLSSILNSARGKNAKPISPFTIQHYWQGMLHAVQVIHQEGIIHSDLKPANFLLVNETVKLIDFGIASSIQQDMTSVIKDSQAGTFNYMSPESLMDVHSGPIINGRSGDRPTIKIGVKSDVWSLGCILYNLVYGRTPFQHISNPLQKLSAISDPSTKINFPEIENKLLLEVLQLCLQFDQRKRPSISQLLEHPYLTAKTGEEKTPQKEPRLKSMLDQLAQLTPNSLSKINSMMQQMHSDSKPHF